MKCTFWVCFCCTLAMINPCTLWIPTIELASAALWLWSILVPGESRPLSLLLLPFGYDQSLYLVNPDHWAWFCCPLAMINPCTWWIPTIEFTSAALWLWLIFVPCESRGFIWSWKYQERYQNIKENNVSIWWGIKYSSIMYVCI